MPHFFAKHLYHISLPHLSPHFYITFIQGLFPRFNYIYHPSSSQIMWATYLSSTILRHLSSSHLFTPFLWHTLTPHFITFLPYFSSTSIVHLLHELFTHFSTTLTDNLIVSSSSPSHFLQRIFEAHVCTTFLQHLSSPHWWSIFSTDSMIYHEIRFSYPRFSVLSQ